MTLQRRSCAASMALMMSAAKSSATVTKRCKTSSTTLTALPLLSSQTMWSAECSALCRRAATFWATASKRFRQSSTRGRALALRASTPSRAATRSARLALRSASTGTPSQARTALGHLIRSTPARSFLISVQAGYPDKGCPALCRYTGLQQAAHLVFCKHQKWLFLARSNDNKPVFRYPYNASIELDSRAGGGIGGVRRFSHKLHQRRIRRTLQMRVRLLFFARIQTKSRTLLLVFGFFGFFRLNVPRQTQIQQTKCLFQGHFPRHLCNKPIRTQVHLHNGSENLHQH